MLILKIPSASGDRQIRVAAMGTCRVRGPLKALAARGDIELVAWQRGRTTTALETLLYLDRVIDDVKMPSRLEALMGDDQLPDPANLRPFLREGVDVFLVEFATADEFHHGDTPLRERLISSKLVRPHKGALLEWYRQVCKLGAAENACVESTLGKLRDAGFPDDGMEDILRGVRHRRFGVEDFIATLRVIIEKVGQRGVVVGPFTVAGEEGSQMSDRRALLRDLRAAAERCDVLAYDPSRLVEDFGKEKALAREGQAIYHYNDDFVPIVGRALVDEIRRAVAA